MGFPHHCVLFLRKRCKIPEIFLGGGGKSYAAAIDFCLVRPIVLAHVSNVVEVCGIDEGHASGIEPARPRFAFHSGPFGR